MKLKKSHIKSEWSESNSGDGYWITLKKGFKAASDPVGCVHAIHEESRAEAHREGVLICVCKECLK